jgi:RNA polymerase sigma-70 factor (ECF subfamily)
MTSEEEFRDLVERVRRGDEQAAAELVRRYEPEIRLEVRVRLRLRHPRLRRVLDSMDVCQLVLASFFVRAAAGQYDLERPEQLLHLLRDMARNKLADQAKFHQRRRRDLRREHAEEAGALDPAGKLETPSELVANRELLEAVRQRLSDEERGLVAGIPGAAASVPGERAGADLRRWAGAGVPLGAAPGLRGQRRPFVEAQRPGLYGDDGGWGHLRRAAPVTTVPHSCERGDLLAAGVLSL